MPGRPARAAVAVDGPALRTTICHRTVPPAIAVPEISDFVADTSAEATVGPAAVAEFGVGSLASETAVAVLVIVVPGWEVGGNGDDDRCGARLPTATAAHEQRTAEATGGVVPMVVRRHVPPSLADVDTSVVAAGIGSSMIDVRRVGRAVVDDLQRVGDVGRRR